MSEKLIPLENPDPRDLEANLYECDSADGKVKLRVAHWARDPSNPSYFGVLCVVHGLSEHIGRWKSRCLEFSRKGFDVWSYDHRGHGLSGGERTHLETPFQLVEDLAHVLHLVRQQPNMGHNQPLFLFGHSMGGLIVTSFAEAACCARAGQQAFPNMRKVHFSEVTAFGLSAPALCTDVAWLLRKIVPVVSFFTSTMRLPAEIKGEHLSSDPKVAEAYFGDKLVTDTLEITTGFASNFMTLADSAAQPALLKKINDPVFLFHGEEDVLVPPRASVLIDDNASNVIFTKLAKTRHESHNEPAGNQILDEMIQFFASQPRKKATNSDEDDD